MLREKYIKIYLFDGIEEGAVQRVEYFKGTIVDYQYHLITTNEWESYLISTSAV